MPKLSFIVVLNGVLFLKPLCCFGVIFASKTRWGKGGDSLQQGQGADLNHEFYCTVSAGTETGIVYIYI